MSTDIGVLEGCLRAPQVEGERQGKECTRQRIQRRGDSYPHKNVRKKHARARISETER